MPAAVGAEILKLRKRPALWVLFAVLLGALVLFGYALPYLFSVARQPGAIGAAALPRLLPEQSVSMAVAGLAGFGGAFAVIVGVLSTGSEYGWRTAKTIVVQRPSRLAVGAGKTAGLGLVMAVFALSYFTAALGSSLLIAVLQGAQIRLPGAGAVVAGLGVGWLTLFVWAVLGMVLGMLTRGTGLAVGLGIIHILVLEPLVLALPLPATAHDALQTWLVGPNTLALAQSLGERVADGTPRALVTAAASPRQAVAVLLVHVVVALAVAGAVFRRRDIA